MKRILATILTLACVASLVGAALAQRGPGGHPGGPPPPGGPGFGPGGMGMGGPPPPPPGLRPPSREELARAGVSAGQRAKLEAIRGDAQRASIRTRADLEVAELDLRDLMESDHADRADVERAIEKVGALRTELHKTHALAVLAARGVLTAEQRAKLEWSRRAGPRGAPDGSD